MTIENALKNLILTKYKSIREFTIAIDMPYTTIDSIFKRGIGNSSIGNIIKICKALRISVDELADGRITPISEPKIESPNSPIEIDDILTDTTTRLLHSENLTINGERANSDTINSIVQGIEVFSEMAKRHNKDHNKNHNKN